MKIIKRNGAEVGFDITKIIIAITKANESVEEVDRMTPVQIQRIAESVELQCQKMNRAPTVEEIQDMVENQLMNKRAFTVARNYITYRYKRAIVRKSNSTDQQILSLLECNNEEVKQENSNKNPTVNSVQRDYMAGEVSKDITKRFLLPPDIVDAHEQGLIHFHDADYFAQHMHNCCLVNLEDMLQNGTVISETMIDKPKSFEMLLVASQNRWEDCQDNGIVCAAMPIKVNDLVSTIEMMLQAQVRRRRKLRSQPRRRSPQEQKIIDDAKAILMERNNMSEQEAFRYIQKCSMDSGNTMVESATMVMGIYQDV